MDRSPFFADAPDASLPVHRSCPPSAKVLRSAIARLLVEAEHCRLVLPRVFDALRGYDIAVLAIAAERGLHIQTVELQIAALSEKHATILLQHLRRLKNVRAARFAAPLAPLAPIAPVAPVAPVASAPALLRRAW